MSGFMLIHVDEEESVERRSNFQGANRAAFDLCTAGLRDMCSSAAKSINVELLKSRLTREGVGVSSAVFFYDLQLDFRPGVYFVKFELWCHALRSLEGVARWARPDDRRFMKPTAILQF